MGDPNLFGVVALMTDSVRDLGGPEAVHEACKRSSSET